MEKKWTISSHVIAYGSLELLFGMYTFHFNCYFEDFNCVFMQIRCLSRVLTEGKGLASSYAGFSHRRYFKHQDPIVSIFNNELNHH